MPTAYSGPTSSQAGMLLKVNAIFRAYHGQMLGGTSHELFPALPRDCHERYLYFTLAPALNFQRRSEGLWRSALATWQDEETRFAYSPEAAVVDVEVLRSALSKHRLGLQPNRHTHIWYTISQTLVEKFDGDVRRLLADQGHDVDAIKAFVTSQKSSFPYLSGPKLLNYWLYMLDTYTDVEFSSRDRITIIPDVHVRRASAVLGLSAEGASAESVASDWENLLRDCDLAPCDVHAPLWRWSRAKFPAVW